MDVRLEARKKRKRYLTQLIKWFKYWTFRGWAFDLGDKNNLATNQKLTKHLSIIQYTLATTYKKFGLTIYICNMYKCNCNSSVSERLLVHIPHRTDEMFLPLSGVLILMCLFFHCCFTLERDQWTRMFRSRGAWTRRFHISWPKPVTPAWWPFEKSRFTLMTCH